MALAISDIDSTMELVMKNIYSSCDIQNTNLVPTSKLIEFIMPYMLEDLSALESLKSSLDPKNEDVSITSEKFYEIMNEWAQKIAGSNEDDEDFLRTPSQLNVIDDKCLPYTQSTPRASFGQKLLRCEGLLNLSNESFYNISASVDTKDNSTVGAEKTMMLEEQIKRLEHQLNKVTGEMDMVKIQLTLTEEQNDQLQSDLERCRTRLSSEQQVNDHLQKSKSCVDELKEEIRFGKRRIEELNKKLSQYEKDNIHLNNYIHKIEKENIELEEKLDYLVRREQDWKKELFDMKTELDMKDHEIISMTKLNEELKLKLSEKKNLVDQLTNENELLDYKKQGLEKVLSSRRYSSSSQYKTCLEEISSLSNRGTVPIYSPPFNESHLLFSYNSPNFLKKVLSPVSPNLGSPIYPLVHNKERLLRKVLKCSSPIPREIDGSPGFFGAKKSFSLNNLNLSLPNIYCAERSNVVQDQSYEEEFFFESQLPDFRNGPHTSLQAELFQVDYQLDKNSRNGTSHLDYDETDYTRLQNETMKLKEENDKLQADLQASVDKTTELQVKLSHIMFEKRNVEESLKESKIRIKKLEGEISKLKAKLDHSNVNNIEQRDKNKTISELEKELNESIYKYKILESAHTSQKEELSKLKSKFNFESAYKTLQRELNERNKELLELRQMTDEYKNMICKLTNSNQELENTLRQFKMESRENEKTALNANENTEETANQVQSHIDKKKAVIAELQEMNSAFENNIEKLQAELSGKIKEVSQLKDILKSNETIKNQMWRDSKKLENDIQELRLGNQNLHSRLEESESTKKDLKKELSDIMSKYKEEVDRNGDLLKQISGQKQELSQLLEQVTALKKEVDCIKHVQKEDKQKINQKLSDYENLLHGYETKTKDLRNVNEQLRIELENERKKQLKEDGVSEELFNKLRAFQEMLQNLETKISELENQNEILRGELECERGKAKKAQDGDSSSDCSSVSFSMGKLSQEPKSRTFEKQKITIDRLKDKVERLEGKLTSEKLRCDVLKKLLNEKENTETKLKGDYDEAKNIDAIEKHKLQNTIDELASNMKAQEEYYKRISDSSNEKMTEISSKLSQFEENNQKLSLELREKESQLHAHLKANENNKKIIDNLNRKLQELDIRHSKVSLELAESKSGYAKVLSEYKTFQQNSRDQQSKILQELADRKDAYADIVAEYKTFQQKMEDQQSKLLLELSERKNSYADLLSEHKTFQQNTEDQQSQVFLELTEKENAYASLLLEYKTFREKLSKTDDHKEKELMDTEERIKQSRMVLESLDAELEAARKRVGQAKTEEDCVSERMLGIVDVVRKCSDELSSAFSRLSEKWDNVFGNDPNYRKLPPMKTCHTLEVDEGILVLNDNIKVTVSLLEMLSAKALISMDDPDSQTLNTQQVNSSDSKTVKKFTLRPPRLILNRPASPDSPSIELDVPPFEPPDQEASEGCHILSEETSEITDIVPEKCSSSHLPYLSLDLPFQDAFPHVTDNFLEKLGLHAGSPKQKLSKDETEKLFTTFAIQIALDSRDIKERLYKQKQQCFQQHKKCFYLIKDISMRLRDHRCIGASDPINPVFVLLEDVRFLLQEMVQSAGQLGILTCENRMMKCWNLVTNYMAVIKQNSAEVEQISPNRTREVKLFELKNFSEGNSNPVEDKTDFKKKPKEPLAKTNPTKEKIEEYRRSWFTKFAIAVMWAFIFVFLFLILLISIHWQCKMTTDHQICPLDDFIKKIRVGSPPY